MNEITSKTETLLFIGIDENGEDIVLVSTFDPNDSTTPLKHCVLKMPEEINGKIFVTCQLLFH